MILSELIIELIVDFITIILGIIVIIRHKQNKPRLFWGITTVFIGVFFCWENINWICICIQNPKYEYNDILNLDKILKWFAPATLVSLFPVASLRPGYLNKKRILVYFLPFLCVSVISGTYLINNEPITHIYTASEIFYHIDKFDIKLRLLTFIISIIIPLTYFTYPVLSRNTYRKLSPKMFIYLGFNFLLLTCYMLFTLNINTFIFNAFGITTILFAITMSIMYLNSENPLSVHVGNIWSTDKNNSNTSTLFFAIENYLNSSQNFKDPNYTIKELTSAFSSYTESDINQAIKKAGFTGFREFMNYHRLECFKNLSVESPNKTIKELMFECGFTSRTTFYRIFSEQYGISPVNFRKNQNFK